VPRRVVCIGGALTEIVYTLGAGDRLVGVDTTSVYPSAARALPQVGYQRTLSAEGILALTPELVIATTDAGPPAVLRQLRDAGVQVELVPIGYSQQALEEKVRRVAAALRLDARGQLLQQQIADGWRGLQRQIANGGQRPRVLFILAHAGPALMVAGAQTAAHAMIELAGGTNAAGQTTGYKPLNPEALIGSAPEVILITDEGLEAVGGKPRLLAKAGLSQTPAARAGRVISMNALLLLGFGPRTPEAAQQLAQALSQQVAR
jgi:iron complex transport system substrate-binding protein